MNDFPEFDPVELWRLSGLTQMKMAEWFGVEKTTFARWCNGDRKPQRWAKRMAAELKPKILQT
ncbi:helix-turn-helix transcriptional regulator [Laspinema sp. D1]|uniref:Helix-turn-helix transcriptional regulator n=1 Tax=Laspinema palackyanum D2a TaxID=2953684 RepID=A0ABT2MYA1_9CYAN|nr:helix-turn-helix transcriptional regulator [Laspinema sp. D2a]